MSDGGSSTATAATMSAADAKARMAEEQQPFWSSKVKEPRKGTIMEMGKGLVLITIVLWVALPFFWGSNWLLLRYFSQLTIVAVDFESPAIGQQNAAVGPLLTQMAQQTNVSPMRPHLGIDIRDASTYPGGPDQVKRDVGYSNYWGGIIVYPNCTSTWTTALETGNTTYDPTGCIGIVYSGARFYQIVLLYLVPIMSEFVGMVEQMASTQALQAFLTANSGNAAVLNNAAAVPQALATPFSYFEEDLRPINQWATAAPFEAALIYYLILAYIMAMWNHAARAQTQWNQKLHFHWLVIWRIALPMIEYVWISLMFSLLFKAFLIPNDASYGNVGGFFALWALNYLCLCAVGLALESMLALLTPEFLPFFLICWIIMNITSSFQPIEVMEKFYQFLYWTPFLNAIEGYKIISYGTRVPSRIGLNFGVLIAVTAVNILFLTLFLMVERRREEKQIREKMEQESKGKSQ